MSLFRIFKFSNVSANFFNDPLEYVVVVSEIVGAVVNG